MSDHVIKLENRRLPKCHHRSYILDSELATVECKQCGLHINPIKVLQDIVYSRQEESRRRAERDLALKETEKKLRTKCEHCNKITKIRYRLSDWKVIEAMSEESR